jgi:hypothetical protein
MLELFVVLADFSFQSGKLSRQLFVFAHQLSQAHESTDNIDTHSNGSW